MMTLHHLLLDVATAQPDAVAVHGDGDELTWREYERASRRLAQQLVAAGIGRGDRVAVSRLKTAEGYVAVHAVLRAGAVVVPIDPLAPAVAAQRVLAEADVAGAVLDDHTTRALDPATHLADARLVVAPGFTEWSDAIAEPDADDSATVEPELPEVGADDPAYIIFTSGSTGTPKGIVHTHRSGRAYVDAAVAAHSLSGGDVVSGMCPFHFDMSTLELYAAPLVGAPVVIMNEAVMRFPASFAERAAAHRLSVIYTVPFFLRSLAERGALDQHDLSSLRQVIYAGEPYPPRAVAELMAVLPETTLVTNAYGPAETNVSNVYDVEHLDPEAGEVPIGRAWSAARVRVVDDTGADVAPGVPGELLIASDTMMAGYWRRPDLTEAAIVVDGDGVRWYRSGDIVVADADGVCHFRGRRDHQVKVRGVRLELEAIESVVTDSPAVVHAVVGPAGTDAETDHVGAVVVVQGGTALDEKAIRRWCAARLHPAAVPQWVEAWDAFPETASGKIDRKVIRGAIARRTDQRTAAAHLKEAARAR